MSRSHDTVLLTGWLFADLLLALVCIFLVANTGGIKLKPILPPILIVTPTDVDANATTSRCTGGTIAPQCTLTIKESADSTGNITWEVSNDFSPNVDYSPNGGTLAPGQEIQLTIKNIPCRYGTLKFTAFRQSDRVEANPVNVLWHCVPLERLDLQPQKFILSISDVNAFLHSNALDNDIRQQVIHQSMLQGKSVGLAIPYGGAPGVDQIPQALQVSSKVQDILKSLDQVGFHVFQRSSYYRPLYTLSQPQSEVDVDVFFFTKGSE